MAGKRLIDGIQLFPLECGYLAVDALDVGQEPTDKCSDVPDSLLDLESMVRPARLAVIPARPMLDQDTGQYQQDHASGQNDRNDDH